MSATRPGLGLLLFTSTLLALAAPAQAATRLPGPFNDSGASYTLAPNGDMETAGASGALGSWSVAGANHLTFGQDSAFAYAGNASGALVNSAFTNVGAGIALHQLIWTTPGEYVISAYAYNDLDTGNAYIDLGDQSYPQADGGDGDCTAASTPGAGAWQFLYCQFTVTSARNIRLRTVIDATIPADSYAAFDQVAITPAASFTPPVRRIGRTSWPSPAPPSAGERD